MHVKIQSALVLISLLFTLPLLGAQYTYCVQVPEINFNPNRDIKDGNDLAYFLLTLKSYIGESADSGILKKYEFSPDGKSFTAIVNESAKWPDGLSISAKEAALGIAIGFANRPVGERVKIKEFVNNGKFNGDIPGLELLSDTMFKISFESKIANVAGVVREALSVGTRQNRIWPLRLSTVKSGFEHYVQIIGKYPVVKNGNHYEIHYNENVISLATTEQCKNGDFSIYPEILSTELNNFGTSKLKQPQLLYLELNTGVLSIEERSAITSIVWSALKSSGEQYGIELSPRFFLKDEPGYNSSTNVSEPISGVSLLTKKHYRIGVSTKLLQSLVLSELKKYKYNISVNVVRKGELPDASLMASAIIEGRMIALQDLLDVENTAHYLAKAPKTYSALRLIAKQSSATVPPNNNTLQQFESAALAEKAIIPIARKYMIAYSRKTTPIVLVWKKFGELEFENAAQNK